MKYEWQMNKPSDVWRRVDIRGPNECWPLTMKRDHLGYGKMKLNGKNYFVHRIVYAITNPGTIQFSAPQDKTQREFVLHICDNRSCANPAHMKLGNHADNMADMAAKGRAPSRPGELNHRAKINNKQAEEIRWIGSKGIHYTEIARLYAVSRHCIRDILNGRTFA